MNIGTTFNGNISQMEREQMKIQDDPYYKAGYVEGALTVMCAVILIAVLVGLVG